MKIIQSICLMLIISFSGNLIAAPPSAPVIAWLPETIEDGHSVNIEWNLWWGVNGTSWTLFDNHSAICQDSLLSNGNQAQKGSCQPTLSAGSHQLQVDLCNVDGCTESQIVTLMVGGGAVNNPPQVSMESLASVNPGQVVDVVVNASDSDGTISQVAFLLNNQPLGVDSSAPYSWSIEAESVGNFLVTAIATDELGATASTSEQLVVVEAGSSPVTSLLLDSLPVQINLDQGETGHYIFDQTISRVLSRKSALIELEVDHQTLKVKAKSAGRTGLKITTSSGKHYYLGLRINHSDGELPGLPKYLSIGSVSEDSESDLDFWRDIDSDLTNKDMDIRYIYINGGPMERGWQSWGGKRAARFTEESLRLGMIPFFVYYNIPDGGESFTTDLAHIRDIDYMNDYFDDINIFMEQVESVANGELYGIILEPDFLGYFQQNGVLHLGTNDPSLITTVVGKDSIAENAGTIQSLVERINRTIQRKRRLGHNIFYGWQINLWADATFSASQGVLRRTDDLGWEAGREAIRQSAEATTRYAMDAGVLSNGADFISIDKYGLDAMIHQNTINPADSTWFFNNDHWMNYLYFVKTIHQTSSKPVILWQLPVGHINGSQQVSAYTGNLFSDLPNVATKGEDSSTSFFFGDSLRITDEKRLQYFSQNLAADDSLTVSENEITFGSHFASAKESGVIAALFGAGVGVSTDGVGSDPTDDYFWIQKVQSYYQNSPVTLDIEYGKGSSPCQQDCEPWAKVISPASDEVILSQDLSTVNIEINAFDDDGHIVSLTAEINNQPINLSNNNNENYLGSWTPQSYGEYVLEISLTDNLGLSTSMQSSFQIISPETCILESWHPDVVYPTAGIRVEFNGDVYENKWWASGLTNSPDTIDGPWENKGKCNASS